MDNQKQIEQLVLLCIDTAKEMLKEYKVIIPFGIRSFNDSEDMKMNCPGDKIPDMDYSEQIDNVVSELKEFVVNENIFATAFVMNLESDDGSGIGLQIETEQSSVLFVYPYREEKDDWVIDEPIQTGQLMTKVF
ncbi:MAG: hypothetical protein KAT25_00315 [Sulfuriflexus sp.]|nr:hypothetical protein [Sulfuriflexus sp.]